MVLINHSGHIQHVHKLNTVLNDNNNVIVYLFLVCHLNKQLF